jgi:hypothetical protein
MSEAATRRLPGAAAWAWDGLLPSWPLLAALLVFGRLLMAGTALLNDPDTYLHIAAGRWILAHGALPVHDPFSHSMPGASWISSEWLAQILLAAAHDQLGWSGVVVLAAACVAAAVGLLAHFLLRRWPPLPVLVAVALATAMLQPHCLARPHVIALPLLVLWTALLLDARDSGRPPPFAALAIMALWTNLHGSFLFGLAFAGFMAAEAVLQPCGASRMAEARRWGLFVLAALGAALLSPHFINGIIQPVHLMTMPALQAIFIEWRSPDFQQFPGLELWLLAAVLVGFGTGARLPPMRLVLLLGLIHMALQHVRHADILAIVGPLAVASPLAPRLAELVGGDAPSRLAAWFSRFAGPAAAPAIVLAGIAAGTLALPLVLHPVVRGDDLVTPGAALAAAQRLGLAGPVLNSQPFGGYLAYRGVPTFIDGRIEMYGNDFLAAAFQAENGSESVLTGLLARYRAGWTLLSPQSAAAGIMDRLPGWKRVHADDRAAVHRRIEPDAR